MSRTVLAAVVAVVIALGQSAVLSAPKKEKRAYKPAERRQQQREADAQPSAAGATYETELQAAKEKRDKDLADASANETDRRALEKRKQEIMSQYAAILAALRDKYQASRGQDPRDPRADPAPARKPGKAGRQNKAQPDASADEPAAGKARDRNRKSRNAGDSLEAAQANLDEENQRHQSKLAQLNTQLQQAQASGNQRETRRAQKAIEKENNAYEAKRTILERRVRDAGGTPAPATTAE